MNLVPELSAIRTLKRVAKPAVSGWGVSSVMRE